MIAERRANLWTLYAQGWYVLDPINLTLDKSGSAVMGGGISRQVKDRFPSAPAELGAWISRYCVANSSTGTRISGRALRSGEVVGRVVFLDRKRRLVYLATKYDWRAPASPSLIERGLSELAGLLRAHGEVSLVLPRLGAGLGGLDWAKDVLPLVERHLDRPGLSERILLVRP